MTLPMFWWGVDYKRLGTNGVSEMCWFKIFSFFTLIFYLIHFIYVFKYSWCTEVYDKKIFLIFIVFMATFLFTFYNVHISLYFRNPKFLCLLFPYMLKTANSDWKRFQKILCATIMRWYFNRYIDRLFGGIKSTLSTETNQSIFIKTL